MQVPYTNDGERAVHVDGKRILPGETRLVSEQAVRKPSSGPVATEETGGDVIDLLGGTVAEITDALPHLSTDQLHQLLQAEETAGRPRTTLLSALQEEILQRTGDDGAANDPDPEDDLPE